MNQRTTTRRSELHTAIAAEFASVLELIQAGRTSEATVLAAKLARTHRDHSTYFAIQESHDAPAKITRDPDDSRKRRSFSNAYGDDYVREYITHETRCLRNE
jgi:hypothetical protein